MKIYELKKIASVRTKGDIFEKTSGNISFIGMADNHFDALLEVAETLKKYVNKYSHNEDCKVFNRYSGKCDCGLTKLEEAIAKLEGVEG